MRRWTTIISAAILSIGLAAGGAYAEPVKVFAAASLKNALDAVAVSWKKADASRAVVATYAATSALAKQIEEGAPADIFFSADEVWMDRLAGKGLLEEGTRSDIAGNGLVLIAPAGSQASADFSKAVDLQGLLAGGRLALANVDSVPAGKYARQSLENLKLWESVSASVAQAENVRAALALVARGEAPLGIVYESDAKVEKDVKVVAALPDTSHVRIVYPAAIVATSGNADAGAFLSYLKSAEAQGIFATFGFRTKN
jgi:molybdate transport system substrate-binding protein